MHRDTFSWEGAEVLAERIRAYWKDSPTLKVWVEKGLEDVHTKQVLMWHIRSNMVNGLPPTG